MLITSREFCWFNVTFAVSLIAQLVKNPPAMWEAWVRSLGWEDSQEKGKATHSSVLTWRVPWTVVHGVAKSRTRLSDFHFLASQVAPWQSVPVNAGDAKDAGLIPGLGRSPGVGNGNLFQYSFLDNPWTEEPG